MFPLPVLGRKSFRAYVFLVAFACTLAGFTLSPISISDSVTSTPLRAKKTLAPYLLLGYQAHWPDPASASHLEQHDSYLKVVSPESRPSIPQQLLPVLPRPPHTFRPDGLLQVNPNGRHPILDLIDHAEEGWNGKLARASRTLPDAVREYHRRYARAPPPGFDKW
jgi:hypothetical protein